MHVRCDKGCPFYGRENLRNEEDGHTYGTCRPDQPGVIGADTRFIHVGEGGRPTRGWVANFGWVRNDAWCGRHPDLFKVRTAIEIDADVGVIEDK